MDYKKEYEDLKQKFEQYKKESVKWSVEDFTEYDGYEISECDAQKALEEMIKEHDYNNGITWNTVECYLNMYGKRKNDE